MVRYHSPFYIPVKALLKRHNLSQRTAAAQAKISRGCFAQLAEGEGNVEISSLHKLCSFLGQQLLVLSHPENPKLEGSSIYSTVAVSLAVEADGFESWKIHFFNLVDEFRRTLDARLLLLPPPKSLEPRLRALLAAIVADLAHEAGFAIPNWANRRYFLSEPWFLSGMESLKASALIESPVPYRNNNIFVHQNFLSRA